MTLSEIKFSAIALWGVFSMSLGVPGIAQDTLQEHPPTALVVGVSAAVLGGSFVLLDKAWYDEYERSPFHLFNDGEEWLQMDKAGHLFSSYTIGRYGHDAFRFSGMSRKQSIWIGGNLGFLYLTTIEILDGTSAQWGFSVWDMAFNALGSGLFISQQLLWDEQRFLPKFSAHLTDYAAERPDVLGSGFAERIFKDYNGQSYWLSYAPWRGRSEIPMLNSGLLCVSVGYGAEGMVSAHNNADLDSGRADNRFRKAFVSLDLDLTKVRTRSKVLKSVLNVLNGLKVPAPALEFTGQGDVILHGLYF
jgi:hypothetical protein